MSICLLRRARLVAALALTVAACDEAADAGGSPTVVALDATAPLQADAAPPPVGPDATPTPDAAPPADAAVAPPVDGGVEPPPGAKPPGRPCNCDDECAAVNGQAGACVMGLCMVAPSAQCGGGEVNGCPAGFQCWSLQGGAGPFCWPDCEHIGADQCAGECDGDGSCAPSAGSACDAACSAYCGGAAVSGNIGSACADDSDCGGATCYAAEGWIDGYCLSFGCGAAGAACGEGGTCVSGVADDNVCFASCAGPDDCRPGYRCSGSNDGDVCFAGCTGDADCPGGTVCGGDELCVVDFRCSPARSNAGECPAGEICTDGACVPFACEPDGPMEPNETQAEAAAVDGPVEGLQICAGDNDWFSFTPSAAETIYTVGHHSEWGSGNLDAALVNAEGDRVDLAWLLPEGYHDENPRGPMDLEAMSLVGSPDAARFGLHIFGAGGATNNYDLVFREIPYVDGPDCRAAGYSAQECMGITPRGGLDTSTYIVFPAGHPADPYIGEGVFFASGLSRNNTPTYVPSSAHWARRELVMAVRHAIHVVQATYPGTGPLGIGEISMRDGTTPNGHPNGTHYYGANVDLAYYIREDAQHGWGNLVYRPICSDQPNLPDWSHVDTDNHTGHYGECIPGSENTHIVDIPRSALLFATLCATGRVRVFGVDTSVEQALKTEYGRLRDEGTITDRAYNLCMRAQASANDDGSWVWHFNHSHVSLCAQDCGRGKSGAVERLHPGTDWERRLSIAAGPAGERRASSVMAREVAPRRAKPTLDVAKGP